MPCLLINECRNHNLFRNQELQCYDNWVNSSFTRLGFYCTDTLRRQSIFAIQITLNTSIQSALRLDKPHTTTYNGSDYLSMLGLKVGFTYIYIAKALHSASAIAPQMTTRRQTHEKQVYFIQVWNTGNPCNMYIAKWETMCIHISSRIWNALNYITRSFNRYLFSYSLICIPL